MRGQAASCPPGPPHHPPSVVWFQEQALLLSAPPALFSLKAVRLWVHECERVFRDRMVSDADAAKFDEYRSGVTATYFEDVPGAPAAIEARPMLYTSFMQVGVGAGPPTGLAGRQRLEACEPVAGLQGLKSQPAVPGQ